VLPLKYLPARTRKFAKSNPAAVRYVIDGLYIAFATSIAMSGFGLFAIRLGADDFQLSLLQFLPQIFTLLVLIPGGLFMDSLHNKKGIVTGTLAALMFGYFLCSLSPFAASYSIPFFLSAVTLAGVANALFNIAWQSFFPGVVVVNTRNKVLTLRTRVFLFISMIVPLLTGVILTNIGTVSGKIKTHQIFFISSIILLFMAVLNFRKFRVRQPVIPRHITLPEIKRAGKSLLGNKSFILFTGAALFFHMTWHFDWTLYFIGQVNYLKMNEFQLGLAPFCGAAIQLLTIKFWSRMNERRGVELPFTFGILGLSLCPAFMIISVSLPVSAGPHIFVILHTIAHIPFCVITLNLFQCLLQVIDNEYRSFYLSVFACILCLSNAVMPVAGVALYHGLGADLNGFRYTMGIIFVLRIIAAGLWLLRWRKR